MFISHNPPHQNQGFTRDMVVIQQSRPLWTGYVLQAIKSNPEFLAAAWKGEAMLEGQDGTIYSYISHLGLSYDSPALTLWEARWAKTIYTGAGEIQAHESHLFTVTLPSML